MLDLKQKRKLLERIEWLCNLACDMTLETSYSDADRKNAANVADDVRHYVRLAVDPTYAEATASLYKEAQRILEDTKMRSVTEQINALFNYRPPKRFAPMWRRILEEKRAELRSKTAARRNKGRKDKDDEPDAAG